MAKKSRLKWGILGTANIAVAKVIPAMQYSQYCSIAALAGRNLHRTKDWAEKLSIPKAYGSYEELLADEEIEAVYIPLPNHLHVPYAIKALEANKHVLCEKPIALNARDAQTLVKVSERTQKMVLEAFMIRNHPQWHRTRELVRSGVLGRVHAVQAVFAYFNTDPANIRNRSETGGGGLMDIGCYSIVASRYVFESEPLRVVALMDIDRQMNIDHLTSCILDYGDGRHAGFICGTQTSFSQGLRVFGEQGGIQLDKPFKMHPEENITLVHNHGEDEKTKEIFPAADHYTLQGDMVSRIFSGEIKPEFSLQDAISNMKVIDALRRSAETGTWVSLQELIF